MRSLFSPTIRPVRLAVLGLALSVVIMVSPASAATGIESLTGYGITQFVASPAGENLVSFDWDSTGALYYTTGAPNFGLGLNVYRNVGGSTTAVYPSPSVFAGSRITAVGPFVFFNDGGDFVRYTYNYFAYNVAQGGAPFLAYDSSAQPLSLWGIDTRDGAQFFASGAVGFGPSSIYYMPTPADGVLNGLVSLGEIGESSGPVAFDSAGNLFYAHGYSFSGQAKIFRWTAAELAAAIANPVLAPLAPANHEWAAIPASFTGAVGMIVDAGGNVYVTANAFGSPGELLLYRPAVAGSTPAPLSLARYPERLETLRLRDGKIHMSCAAGIFRMPVPLSVSLGGDAQIHAVAGKTLTLSVHTLGGEGTLSYRWFLTGVGKADIPVGDDSPTLNIAPAKGDQGRGYYCEVSDAGITVISPTYTLEVVIPAPVASWFTLVAMAMGTALVGVMRVRQRRV